LRGAAIVCTAEDASQTELVDEQHYDIRVGAIDKCIIRNRIGAMS